MTFTVKLQPDTKEIYDALGYGATLPDADTALAVDTAAAAIKGAATPRYCSRRLPVGHTNGGLMLAGEVPLPGTDIAKHLAGCAECMLLGVTLGAGVDAILRAASVADIHKSVLQDTAASVLVESYADAAQQLVLAPVIKEGLYSTMRYSPGYGDFPLSLQPALLRLLDAPRAIGLSVSGSGILAPRKSITALIGIAKQPVTGHLAGCATCALRDSCNHDKPCATIKRKEPPTQGAEV